MNEFLFERIADLLSLRLVLGALGILVGLLRLILDFFHDWVEACKFITTRAFHHILILSKTIGFPALPSNLIDQNRNPLIGRGLGTGIDLGLH
jgi:hypothetical protein